MSTYTEKHKRYYEKNKKKILERNREYKRIYDHEYYVLHKKPKGKERYQAKKVKNFKKFQDFILNQEISDQDTKNVTKILQIPIIKSKT